MDNFPLGPIITVGLPLCCAILGWWIKRLLQERDNAAEDALKAWQRGAIERHARLAKSIERIESCMGQIKKSLNEKVDQGECDKLCAEKWDRLNHHEHVINCQSTDCSARQTSGVII